MNRILKTVVFILLLPCSKLSSAQEADSVTYTNAKTRTTLRLPYSMSSSHDIPGIYTTSLYVMNGGAPFKAITINNLMQPHRIIMEVKDLMTGATEDNQAAQYADTSGLIVTDRLDSVIASGQLYANKFIISFLDESHKDISLHFIQKKGEYALFFDRVSDDLLSRHQKIRHPGLGVINQDSLRAAIADSLQRAYLQSPAYLAEQQRLAQERKTRDSLAAIVDKTNQLRIADSIARAEFYHSLIDAATSLAQNYKYDTTAVHKIIQDVYDDVHRIAPEYFEHLDDRYHSAFDLTREKKGDLVYGVLATHNLETGLSKISVGYFKNRQFVDGKVIHRYSQGESYTGPFSSHPVGLGRKDYPGGDFEVGIFNEIGLMGGISRMHGTEGAYYFGRRSENKKNGFGIYSKGQSNIYVGTFKADKFTDGYCTQKDDVGALSYFRVIDNVKEQVDRWEWQKYYEQILAILPDAIESKEAREAFLKRNVSVPKSTAPAGSGYSNPSPTYTPVKTPVREAPKNDDNSGAD